MQCTPQEIKETLLKALDKDNNVVDMAGVVRVISILETFPITRNDLEETRLGRYVNDLRKKTNNEELAKRAKKLVKSWQQLLVPQKGLNGADRPTHQGRPGMSPSISPALLRPLTPSSGGSRPLTPSSGGSRPLTPSGYVRPLTPSGGKPLTPSASGIGRVVTPSTGKQVTIPGRTQLTVPGGVKAHAVSPLARDVVKSTSYKQGTYAKSSYSPVSQAIGKPIHSTPLSSKSANNNNTPSESLSKTNVANKKRTRDDDSDSKSKKRAVDLRERISPESDNGSTVINGLVRQGPITSTPIIHRTTSQTSLVSNCSSNTQSSRKEKKTKPLEFVKTPAVSKTPKVKTTAQIIAEMQAKNKSISFQSETIEKITSNKIMKERDSIGESIVPAAAKPRPRRKPGSAPVPPSTPDLSQVKTELVKKFLQTSVTPSHVEDSFRSDSPLPYRRRVESPELNDTKCDSFDSNTDISLERKENFIKKETKPKLTIEEELRNIYSELPPLDTSKILINDWEEEGEEEDLTKLTEGSQLVKQPVNAKLVDKINNDEWPGVNGCYDSEGTWHDWASTVSLTSYSSDLIHILPYVDVDG